MTEDEKKTIEQLFEAMGRSGGRFVVGQVVGSQTIHINAGEEKKEDEVPSSPSCVQKDKGGRPKRAGQSINKAFIYDAGNETNVRLQMLYSGLLYLGWIREDTDFRTFLSIFSGNETTCRIVWTGDMNTLAELFRQLVEVNKWVKLPEKESIWIMVNARFWNKEGNKEFGNTNLGATKAPVESKDSISLLVSIMNPESPIKELKKVVQNL